MPRRNLPPIVESLRYAASVVFSPTAAAREALLRTALRRTPRWIDGHLLLAEHLFEGISGSSQPPHQRDLSGIRISATAAKTLLLRATSGETIPQDVEQGRLLARRELEAELWLALYDFLRKQYGEALSRLEILLVPGNSKQISRKHHLLALEYAAAAASVLGRKEDALRYAEEVPSARRSKDLQLLQAALEREASPGG